MFASSSDSKLLIGLANSSDNMVHGSSTSSSSASPGTISYLPPYLMGGSDSSEESSPGLIGRAKKLGGGFGNGVLEKTAQSSSSMEHTGPPVQELFDDEFLDSSLEPNKGDDMYFSAYQNRDFLPSAVTPGKGENDCFTSLTQMDPFYTQGEELTNEDQLDDTWVTVYGFPPASSSYILLQFSQYGTIIEHKVAPHGNWIHIHYQMKMHAKKAISKDGKIFGGNMMVGVKPCVDLSVMNESGKENYQVDSGHNVSISKYDSMKKNIRPLTPSFRSLSTDYEVVPKNNTPQKSDSFLSTTMEFLLNW